MIMHIVGARPNFPKLWALLRALGNREEQVVVHTGQHYSDTLSANILSDLNLKPDVILGKTTVPEIVAALIAQDIKVLQARWMVVYGDVNSTLAGALVANHFCQRLAHVEAGLRCGDWSMPEEVNRYVVDHLSHLLLAPTQEAVDNLVSEGIDPSRIRLVGNVMIDALQANLERTSVQWSYSGYGVVTLHRPSNVDDPSHLASIMDVLSRLPLIIYFPAHPRIKPSTCDSVMTDNVMIMSPQPYRTFLKLLNHARLVITDSGGVQEETSYLGVPCLTLRPSTERPITVTHGTNRLVSLENLCDEVKKVLAEPRPSPAQIPLWDGHAGERVAEALRE